MISGKQYELPQDVRSGPLSYLIERNHRPLSIIGPGPSLKDINPEHIPDSVIRFRMNMFFSEPTPQFGRRVDGYFWANDLDVMYDLMLSTSEDKIYNYKVYFSPNEIKPEKPAGKATADKCRDRLKPRYDHWWLIGHHPDVVRNMLLRPLPTQTFQALATALILGFREIHLVGIDMYRSKGERYAFKYSDQIKARLDEKHRTPGYESAAHSERRDLAFLKHLIKCFPDARIYNASTVSPLREVLPDSVLMHGQPIQVPSDPIRPIDALPRATFTSLNNEVIKLHDELAALRNSRSFRLGYSIMKPLAGIRSAILGASADMVEQVRAVDAPAAMDDQTETNAMRALSEVKTGDISSRPKSDSEFELLAICHEATSKTGGYRPIKNYIEAAAAKGRSVKLLDLTKTDKTKKGKFSIPTAQVTILNSVAPPEWDCIDKYLSETKNNVYVYLHETGWVFNKIQLENPGLYQRITKMISRFPVLCVSKFQQDYIQAVFQPPSTQIIYNVTKDANTSIKEMRLAYKARKSSPSKTKTILMIGSIQERKGPVLFSRLADLAHQKGLPVRFVWAGHQTQEVSYLSERVEWLGHLDSDNLKDVVKKADRMLLSSWDDPFPLSCIEALSWGVPIISFANSGICEVIEGMPGCRVFHDREPDRVLKLVMQALQDDEDPDRLFFHVRPYTDTSHFIRVLDQATRATSSSSPTMERETSA